LVIVALEIGAGIVPPPCWASVTIGVTLLAVKLVPVTEISVPTEAEGGVKLVIVGAGATVNAAPLLARPDTVTTTFPVVALLGTGTAMLVAPQLVGVPVIPLKVTVLAPWLDPKFVPVMVTAVPITPDVGLRLVMLGVAATVNVTPLLATLDTVTTTFPVAAPLGTGTTMVVALQLVGVPAVPLNLTVLVPCVAPKFVPVTVTDVLANPDVGFRLVMLGVGATVNATPLLATLDTVTTTFPVVAPLGTGTTMLVALQLVGVPAVPLNLTVLVPCVDPKFSPVTVTDVPTAPDVGLRLKMLGAVPPPLAALNAANTAPHGSDEARVALAEAVPADVCNLSSAISLVFGSAGTCSSISTPLGVV